MTGAAFGIACLLVVVLSFIAWRGDVSRHGDVFAISAMLFMTWCISNVLVALYHPPDCWTLYPVMDLICGGAVAWMWATKPALWKLLLVGLFAFECCAHVAFWLQREKTYGVQYLYALVLNVAFGAQLLVAAWPGGARLGAVVVDHLFARPGAHHPAVDP